MSNDELLEKLYEGTLTESEVRELENRAESSPEFASEVREFRATIKLLREEAENEVEASPAIVADSRDKILTLIAAGALGTAAVSTAASSTASGGIGFGITQWAVAVMATLSVGGLIVWNVLTPTNIPQKTEQIPQKTTPAQAQKEQNFVPNTPEQAPKQESHISTKQEEIRNQTSEPKQATATNADEKKPEGLARTDNSDDKNDVRMALEHYKQKADNKLAFKDYKGLVAAYLEMTKMQLELNQLDDAKVTLEKARVVAEREQFAESTAEISGYFGKIALARGEQKIGIKLLSECVEALRKLVSPKTRDWETELRRAEK